MLLKTLMGRVGGKAFLRHTAPVDPQFSYGNSVTFMNDGTSLKSVRQIRRRDNLRSIIILNGINTLSCPSKSNSKQIELTSCYWGLRLTLCYNKKCVT